MKFAFIKDRVVQADPVEAGSPPTPPDGQTVVECPPFVKVGWIYTAGAGLPGRPPAFMPSDAPALGPKPTVADQISQISGGGFLRRFTEPQRSRIRKAAALEWAAYLADPAGTGAPLSDFLFLLVFFPNIVKTDSLVVAGMVALVSVGLLTQAESDVILA